MFIEIVHINGSYDPEANQHTPPFGSEIIRSRLGSIARKAITAGCDVLYKPNLNGNFSEIVADAGATALALASDPFLSRLSEETRGRIVTRLDGRPSRTANAYTYMTNDIEDDLAQKHHQGFVLGAFTDQCVRSTALNIKSRNPDATIMIDPNFCVQWPGSVPVFGDGSIPNKDLNSALFMAGHPRGQDLQP